MKIGIVGAGISENDLKPYEDEYELWGLNNLYVQFPNTKFSKWFEIHEFSCKKNQFFRRGRDEYGFKSINQYLRDLNEINIPVYMRRKLKRIKKAELFPFEKIISKYGTYFGCSFAWMIAYALEIGVKEIGFFGVKLEGNEYYYQRPSVEYLTGIAVGSGVTIFMHNTSRLLRGNYIYAYKENYDLVYLLHGQMSREIAETYIVVLQQKINDIVSGLQKGGL